MMLSPKSYPFPTRERWINTIKRMAIAYVLAVIQLGLLIWVAVDYGAGRGLLAICSTLGVTLLISGWGTFLNYTRKPMAKYEVGPLTVVQKHLDYYVPPEVFGEFLEFIYAQWEQAKDLESPARTNPARFLTNVTLILERNKPRYPATGEEKVGLTYHKPRYSRVYAPHVLNYGGAGYELCLHICQALYPGREEGEDIAWMKDQGIIGQGRDFELKT
jgi:hypothetical protein